MPAIRMQIHASRRFKSWFSDCLLVAGRDSRLVLIHPDGYGDTPYGMPILVGIQHLLPISTVQRCAIMAKPNFFYDAPRKARLTRFWCRTRL